MHILGEVSIDSGDVPISGISFLLGQFHMALGSAELPRPIFAGSSKVPPVDLEWLFDMLLWMKAAFHGLKHESERPPLVH